MVAVSISPRIAEHLLTLVWPLPTLAVAAHKLATTEQSDTASCTRSTLCRGTVITGFDGGWSPVCNDGGGRASFARFQPSRYFIWWGVSKSSWLSLQGKSAYYLSHHDIYVACSHIQGIIFSQFEFSWLRRVFPRWKHTAVDLRSFIN